MLGQILFERSHSIQLRYRQQKVPNQRNRHIQKELLLVSVNIEFLNPTRYWLREFLHKHYHLLLMRMQQHFEYQELCNPLCIQKHPLLWMFQLFGYSHKYH